MHVIAIIPARMGSSRYPGKPLVKIHGIPMIGHVALRTAMCKTLNGVYIATCDSEIADYAHSIDIPAIMTKNTHSRCTDRTAEAMLTIEKAEGKKIDIVVMVQGDEPMVTPDMIDAALEPLFHEKSLQLVNLMATIDDEREFENPAEVKVVTDLQENALYFSREPIPSRKKGCPQVPMKKQVCIIPFRRDYLLAFNALPETPLEIIESVDMLRVLENGGRIKMVPINKRTLSVDTPEDHARVITLMKNDPLIATYAP